MRSISRRFRLRPSAGQKNRLHYCAHAREVADGGPLRTILPDLGGPVADGRRCGECDFLLRVGKSPRRPRPTRNAQGFTLSPDPIPLMPDELVMSDVRAGPRSLNFAANWADDLERLHKGRRWSRFRNYITNRAPRYRPPSWRADRSDLARIPRRALRRPPGI